MASGAHCLFGTLNRSSVFVLFENDLVEVHVSSNSEFFCPVASYMYGTKPYIRFCIH